MGGRSADMVGEGGCSLRASLHARVVASGNFCRGLSVGCVSLDSSAAMGWAGIELTRGL